MHGSQPPARRVPWWVIGLITAGCFLADLLTKEWALSALSPGDYHPVLGQVFGFELVFNPGAAFSFLTGHTWVFTILSTAVTVVLIVLLTRVRSWWWALTLAALLGGTLGNLTDRFFRDPGIGVGHVVDFLNYNGYFVGNVADIFIVAGALAIALLAFRGVPLEGRTETPGQEEDD